MHVACTLVTVRAICRALIKENIEIEEFLLILKANLHKYKCANSYINNFMLHVEILLK